MNVVRSSFAMDIEISMKDLMPYPRAQSIIKTYLFKQAF